MRVLRKRTVAHTMFIGGMYLHVYIYIYIYIASYIDVSIQLLNVCNMYLPIIYLPSTYHLSTDLFIYLNLQPF